MYDNFILVDSVGESSVCSWEGAGMVFIDRMRRFATLNWLIFFTLMLLSWIYLYAMQLPADILAAQSLYGSAFWASLCQVTPTGSGAPTVFAMWGAMSAAMMAPTFIPTLITYADLNAAGARRGFASLLAGYLFTWLGFAILATFAQLGLAAAGWLTPFGSSANTWLSGGLLILAGGYQFSTFKAACLSQCRRPLVFFMQHWALSPWRMGVKLGLICLGCCWALMALAFIGGTMNLLWMGAATVLMIVEKLPDLGRYLTKPLGAALIASGLWTLTTV
jgi:predicted metal-binding membrane protein